MSVDPAAGASPAPGRRPRLTTRALMAAVLGVGLALGLGVGWYRGHRRAEALRARVVRWGTGSWWMDQSLRFKVFSITYHATDLIGNCFRFRGEYKTATGRSITFAGEVHIQPSRDAGHVTISAEGRSVTWPIEDVERGRKIDLRAEFSEAFR